MLQDVDRVFWPSRVFAGLSIHNVFKIGRAIFGFAHEDRWDVQYFQKLIERCARNVLKNPIHSVFF